MQRHARHLDCEGETGQIGLDTDIVHVLEHRERLLRPPVRGERLEHGLIGEDVGPDPLRLHALQLAKQLDDLSALGQQVQLGVERVERSRSVKGRSAGVRRPPDLLPPSPRWLIAGARHRGRLGRGAGVADEMVERACRDMAT